MRVSKTFGANLPNVATFTTDVVFHLYSASGGTGIVVYHDNGASGQDAKIYVPWDTSGASDINIGHSTEAGPIENYANLAAGTYYIGSWWGAFFTPPSLQFEISPTPFTAQTLEQPFRDYDSAYNHAGGPMLFFSTDPSSAITLGSGGTVSVVASGGVNWAISQT